jgi:hypothetical protein
LLYFIKTDTYFIFRVKVINVSGSQDKIIRRILPIKFIAAGIAESGAYNRTLTPFGFRNERRSDWEVLNWMNKYVKDRKNDGN